MGVQPLQLADPLAQYSKVAAIQQAQNQNALAQYQLGAAQREEAAQNALNRAYQEAYNPQTGTYDVNKLRGAVITGGAGAKLPDIEKKLGELRESELKRQKLTGEISAQPVALAAAETKLLDDKLRQRRIFLEGLNVQDPDFLTKFKAWHRANHADPIIGKALAARGVTTEQSEANIDAAARRGLPGLIELLNESKLGTERFMDLNKPVVSTRNLGATTETSIISPLTGETRKISTERNTIAPADAERIRLDGQRLGLEGRRVAVAEAEQRQKSDPEFQRRMAAAKAEGEATAKGDVAARQALPKIIDRADEGIRLIDELVGRAEVRDSSGRVVQAATAPHPGFKNAVGTTWLPGLRFVPGTDEADFMERFDQIKSSAFLEAFENLKGGGSITEKEGEKGTAAINRMAIAQSEKEFVAAARDFQDVIRKGAERARARVSNAPAPAGGGGNWSVVR